MLANALIKYKFIWISLLVITIVMVFIGFMPQPIDMNLEKIGNGRKAIVFVYDSNLSVSSQQSAEMNKARSLVSEDIIFLVAKIGDPAGNNFMRHYDARAADLLFFNIAGDLVHRETALLSAEELARILLSEM